MTKTRPRQSSPLRLSSAWELFPKSYEIIKRNFEVFMVLFSIGALMALWNMLGSYVDDEPAGDWKSYLLRRSIGGNVDTGVFAAGGFMFIVSILYAVAYLLLVIAVLRAAQGHRITLSGLWNELTGNWLWLKMIGAFILFVLAIVAGLILLIIPGVILIWRLFFVPYILVDQKTTIGDAFRRSWNMTRGYAGPIYAVILVSILLSITNIVPVFGPVIAFVLTSIYMVAPALRYVELKKIAK